MQFLLISKDDTLQSISRVVGSHNVDAILSENGIKRMPKIGKLWNEMCDGVLVSQPNDITPTRKSVLLNSVIDSEEVFEKLCLLDEDGWKIFSAYQAFRDAIRVPESVKLPFSAKVIGSIRSEIQKAKIGGQSTSRAQSLVAVDRLTAQSEPVSSVAYKAVMNDLKTSGDIHPEVFNRINAGAAVPLNTRGISDNPEATANWPFPIPWGKILIYSSIAGEAIDIPAFPEQVDTSRSANYTAMPDILYQYEPWIMYESSGPREQNLTFHLHRDMWTGNHRDGKANELIRFCEANTFPEFSGSAVNSAIVTIYISGSKFITGVMTRTDVSWKGPLGTDDWFLEFELTLTIQEVSDRALSYNKWRTSVGLIG